MVSSNLRIAQSTAIKRIGADQPASKINVSDSLNESGFLSQEAVVALDLIMDCFLLLNSNGDIMLSNAKADRLLKKMQPDPIDSPEKSAVTLPDSVLQACQLLLENYELLADQALPPQAMLTVYPQIQLRISLMQMGSAAEQFFLITLEDKHQSSLTQATVDQWLYGLTNREKEVWSLRLQDYSYQEIADQLYLSVNTVKKHMKTILAKQEQWRYDTFDLLAS